MKLDDSSDGTLHVDKRLKFKMSVIVMLGRHYIPFSFDQTQNIFLCFGLSDGNTSSSIDRYLFDTKYFEEEKYEIVGELEYIVTGICNNGKYLQILPFTDMCKGMSPKIYSSSTEFNTIEITNVFDDAKPYEKKRKQRKKQTIKSSFSWHYFYGWMYPHWWSQNTNEMHPRLHVFFRTVREHISGSNFSTKWKCCKVVK